VPIPISTATRFIICRSLSCSGPRHDIAFAGRSGVGPRQRVDTENQSAQYDGF
jgi:hypothetical protein